jgi:hypothetical protein
MIPPGTPQDDDQLRGFGYTPELRRSLDLLASFSIAFSYISPVVGVYTLFGYGLATGPMPSWGSISRSRRRGRPAPGGPQGLCASEGSGGLLARGLLGARCRRRPRLRHRDDREPVLAATRRQRRGMADAGLGAAIVLPGLGIVLSRRIE